MMNGFNFIRQKSAEQSDDKSANRSQTIINFVAPTSNGNLSKVVEKVSEDKKVSQQDIPQTTSLSRKRDPQQTPAEILSEIIKQSPQKTSNEFVQCQISIEDESRRYLEGVFSRQINLAPEEFEDLLIFVEEIEYKRKQEEKDQQEKRSSELAKRIHFQEGGSQFLQSNKITCTRSENGEGEQWTQLLPVTKEDGSTSEISQPLNFYAPQHSWILESWLSQRSVSWTVRRYNKSPEKVVYQVSFGFPDQTFLEAEGPSREGAIMAIAEDLLS